MFHHKFILLACTLAPTFSTPQTFFHTTHGNGGSYTSISHGAGAPQAQSRAYNAPAPTQGYGAPAPSSGYGAPAQSGYGAPAAAPAPTPFVHHGVQQQSYHAPQPAPVQHAVYHAPVVAVAPVATYHHAPAVKAYHHAPVAHAAAPQYEEKCALDYEEQAGEVCVPTLETQCDHVDGGMSVELHEEEECHDVIRTVCTERHTVVDNEVCAYSYALHPVDTEAQLVEPHWEKVCNQESVCLNPVAAPHAGYGAPRPSYCHEEIHETCLLEPTLVPVIKPVTIQLPQPVEVCINKQVVLPHIDCQKAKDRHCMVVPVAEKGHPYQIDKCDVVLGEPACQETVLQLPKQVCKEKINIVKTVYATEEVAYY